MANIPELMRPERTAFLAATDLRAWNIRTKVVK